MYPHELIGKKAVRTNFVQYESGVVDYSYSTEPILIVASTESHIVFEYVGRDRSFFGDTRRILDKRWIDNNWTDYDGLMKLADNAEFIIKSITIEKGEADEN